IPLDKDRKKDALLHLFETRGWHQALIFTRTKHGADALSRALEKSGLRSAALHGNKTQSARVRALADFKDGKLTALVATDIAARGIDIDQLPYVINYELPNIAEDYVHRIGRTGRAGEKGEAYSLVCHDEKDYLKGIERLIAKNLTRIILPGFEPQMTLENPAKPNPPRSGQNRPAQPRPERSGRAGTGGMAGVGRGKPGGGRQKTEGRASRRFAPR
ncbi:MAG: RNA helicase, partial [Zoogloeaceae bacterium]|nr:RNA helicase [Zoogloeaceae bacterium]